MTTKAEQVIDRILGLHKKWQHELDNDKSTENTILILAQESEQLAKALSLAIEAIENSWTKHRALERIDEIFGADDEKA